MSRRYWLRLGTVIPADQKLHPSEKTSSRMPVCGLQEGGKGGVRLLKMSAHVKDGRSARLI